MSTWNSMPTESFPFLSPERWNTPNPKHSSTPRSCETRATLTRSQPGCCSNLSEEKTFGKDPTLSQPDLCSEGHREEKKMLEDERGGSIGSIPDQMLIHNSTFKLCLRLSGRVPTSQTHIARLIWLLPAEMTGITACAAPWVDMTHAGLPDMWSSWTATNRGSPC